MVHHKDVKGLYQIMTYVQMYVVYMVQTMTGQVKTLSQPYDNIQVGCLGRPR